MAIIEKNTKDFLLKLENKNKFELYLEKYKNRMEFLRTIIGLLVLGIQLYLITHWK